MPRRLKDRPWTKEELAHQDLRSLVNEPFFETRFLSNALVFALLSRINRQDQKEASFLLPKVNDLIAVERSLPPLTEVLKQFSNDPESVVDKLISMNQMSFRLLEEIRYGKVPKQDHYRDTISQQRKWLNDYFREHLNKSSLSLRQYTTWVRKHSQPLYDGLAEFECLCEYQSSFDGITEDTLAYCRGLADLTYVILAELHRSTPSAIRKILSHSSKR